MLSAVFAISSLTTTLSQLAATIALSPSNTENFSFSSSGCIPRRGTKSTKSYDAISFLLQLYLHTRRSVRCSEKGILLVTYTERFQCHVTLYPVNMYGTSGLVPTHQNTLCYYWSGMEFVGVGIIASATAAFGCEWKKQCSSAHENRVLI